MKLTIIVLTKNESRHISDCLAGLRQFEGLAVELLVIDDGSDDNTVELAQAAGARVVAHRLNSFAEQRNFALSQVTGGWVFFLDADERFSPDLLAAIARHMTESPDAAGSAVRRNFAFGQRHRFGPLKPDRVTRLFPPDSVIWEGRVHERPVCELPVRPLGGHLRHLTYHSWGQYLAKQHRYADLWAEEGRAAGKTTTPLKAFGRAWAGFMKMFVLNLGFLGGPVAWSLCWYHGAYTLTKYLKLLDKDGKSY
jgi:Glycosyltransferases involved in cell wall biogenesis